MTRGITVTATGTIHGITVTGVGTIRGMADIMAMPVITDGDILITIGDGVATQATLGAAFTECTEDIQEHWAITIARTTDIMVLLVQDVLRETLIDAETTMQTEMNSGIPTSAAI